MSTSERPAGPQVSRPAGAAGDPEPEEGAEGTGLDNPGPELGLAPGEPYPPVRSARPAAAGNPRRWLLRGGAILALLAAGLTWELERSQMLQPGTKAPDFDLAGGDGRRVRLADFAGKPLILYFYPADFTPT